MKSYRLCYRMEIYVDAESEDEARTKFENNDYSADPEFVEILTLEEAEDISNGR
jgi:DNA-dependent RNA polymerase auxiliary subunit epsilon